jgi:hypothetical protein
MKETRPENFKHAVVDRTSRPGEQCIATPTFPSPNVTAQQRVFQIDVFEMVCFVNKKPLSPFNKFYR